MKKALTLIALAGSFAAAQAQTAAPSAPAAPHKAEQLVAMCMGCHNIIGYKSSFPEVYRVPMIAGQSAKYIASALNAYKNGDRKHPTMRGIAGSLTDQDIADFAKYYSQLGGPTQLPEQLGKQPDAQVDALLKKANCVSCHGANLSKPIDPSYPKIAGQHADYLFVALKAYQTEGNPQVGRGNAIMGGMAKPFSHAELKKIAGYLATLPSDLKTVPESRFR